MNRLIALSALLLLVSIACTLSTQAMETPVPVTGTTMPITPNATPVEATPIRALFAPTHLCVTSVGLWLRSSPHFLDDNKLLALPQGTHVVVTVKGAWDRVRVPEIDEYGYVRSDYLGECK